jgi:hypothetical protein
MTIAEQIYNRKLEAEKNGEVDFDTFEFMEELTNCKFDSYRTTFDEGDIIGFEDGSYYVFDKVFSSESDCAVYNTRAELMENISSYNETPWGGDADMGITGVLSTDSNYINCLMLTDTTKDGEPEYWDTDYRNDYEVQQVLVEYTTELAKLIGKKVTLTADTAYFNEGRVGSRGGDFHVKNFYLTNISLVQAEPQLTEV